MTYVVSAINFGKSRGLNHRWCMVFLDEIDGEYNEFF